MEKNYLLRKANKEDVELLTQMSKEAFDSDIEYGGKGGGPTGYDSLEWHADRVSKDVLFALEVDDRVVGGAVLVSDGRSLFVHRVFIDPSHYRKGYGSILMKAIEDFPNVNHVYLDTPSWNLRTNTFYQKCGYRKTGVETTPWFDLFIYEKNLFDSKTKVLLDTLLKGAKEALADNYVGFYIHGSLAMSGFNLAKSDIDYIIICNEEPDVAVKKAILDSAESIWDDTPAKGLEMHLMCLADCLYPSDAPHFVLHYSAMHRQSYKDNPENYIGHGEDPDLNTHLTVMRARGFCYDGRPIEKVFGLIETKNFVACLLEDAEWNVKEVMYHVLNAARSLAFIRDGRILSKREGGIWGKDNIPEYAKLFEDAIDCCDSERIMESSEMAEFFCKDVVKEMNKYMLGVRVQK